jgi:predicted DNA binding protein
MNSNKLSLARVKIRFPDQIWISQIFKKFKDIEMEILYFLPYDLEKSIGNAIIEIIYYDIESIIPEIKNHESVFEFSILEQENNRIKINIKTIDPYLLYGVIKCGILVNFPVNVKDGYAYWRLIGSRERIDQLLTLFEDKGIEFNLLKIGNSPYLLDESTSKLTYEESKTLEDAIKLGFFDIPRKISLEELADKLGKSKSALSVMLRKIIKKKVVLET